MSTKRSLVAALEVLQGKIAELEWPEGWTPQLLVQKCSVCEQTRILFEIRNADDCVSVFELSHTNLFDGLTFDECEDDWNLFAKNVYPLLLSEIQQIDEGTEVDEVDTIQIINVRCIPTLTVFAVDFFPHLGGALP